MALGPRLACAVRRAVAAVAVSGRQDRFVAACVLAGPLSAALLALRSLGDRGVGEGAEELPAGERDPPANGRYRQHVGGGELLEG